MTPNKPQHSYTIREQTRSRQKERDEGAYGAQKGVNSVRTNAAFYTLTWVIRRLSSLLSERMYMIAVFLLAASYPFISNASLSLSRTLIWFRCS